MEVRQDDADAAKQELEAATASLQTIQVSEQTRPEMLRLRSVVESAAGDLDAANRDLKFDVRVVCVGPFHERP